MEIYEDRFEIFFLVFHENIRCGTCLNCLTGGGGGGASYKYP